MARGELGLANIGLSLTSLASANNWAKSDIDNKRDCLRSLIRQGRYIIVKNHNRFVVIDTEWKRHSAK